MFKRATVVLLVSMFAPAAAEEPQAQIAGMGAMSCKKAIELIERKPFKFQLAAWVERLPFRG